MNLTDQLKASNSRTTALENDRLRNQKELSRITKVYGDITISVVVRYRTHEYRVCGSPGLFCGSPSAIL